MTTRGIYDLRGEPFAYLQGDRIYSLDGTPSGTVVGAFIHDLSGQPIWRVDRDGLFDLQWNSLGYLGEPLQGDIDYT